MLITRPGSDWEIGFSAKNQNSAVKHPRLSDTINFGQDWFATSCSPQYMGAVRETFGIIRDMLVQGKKSGYALQWNEIQRKEDKFYTPILDAFEDEMTRLFEQKGGGIPYRLLGYLLGRKDFYKIMKYDKYVNIQGYNRSGTLDMPSSLRCAQNRIPRLKSPSRIVDIEREGKNRCIIILNHG